MSSETLEKTVTVKAEGATPWEKVKHAHTILGHD